MENEEIIENLRQSYPNADNLFDGLEDSFTVSKATKSCSIEFLAENDVEITAWISEIASNDRVKNILRVWFSLFRPYN
jgi:hypothetical protein